MPFFYRTGEPVHVGDHVVTGNRNNGIVEMVIEPGSQASSDYSCPDGGILIEENWDGTPGLLLETPPDRDQWDVVFVSRGDEARREATS